MSILLINAINIAAQEIDRVRNDAQAIDPIKLIHSSILRDQSARTIASGYVWLAASMERYFKVVLQSVFAEINSSGITYDMLKPCLFSSVCSPELASLKQLNDHKKVWPRRIEMFSRLLDSNTVNLNLTEIPYDGGTVRSDHLEVMWAVFGMPGNSIPSPLHRLALTDVADGRNAVAHGEVDPIAFGRSKNPSDFLNTITRIEDIVMHIANSSNDYLLNRGYLR
jgi:hypothetical protein